MNEGLSALQVAEELNEVLEKTCGILYSDAAYWDTDWIDTLYLAVNLQRKFHIESLFELLETQQIANFSEHKSKLAESGKYRQHRAEEDVRLINEAYNLSIE